MGRPKPSTATTDYTPTTLPPSHLIIRLGAPRGGGQFSSVDAASTERLVVVSPKLKRGGVIVTRGDYGVVSLYEGQGVQGEVVHVWSEREVRGFKKAGEWPEGFDEPALKAEPDTPAQEADADEQGDVADGDAEDKGGDART